MEDESVPEIKGKGIKLLHRESVCHRVREREREIRANSKKESRNWRKGYSIWESGEKRPAADAGERERVTANLQRMDGSGG
jgi:hypothetical protein